MCARLHSCVLHLICLISHLRFCFVRTTSFVRISSISQLIININFISCTQSSSTLTVKSDRPSFAALNSPSPLYSLFSILTLHHAFTIKSSTPCFIFFILYLPRSFLFHPLLIILYFVPYPSHKSITPLLSSHFFSFHITSSLLIFFPFPSYVSSGHTSGRG